MPEIVITVDKVSKKYIIAHQNVDRNPTIKDAFAGTARSLMRRFRTPLDTSPLNTTKEEFWALSDISFQIGQGDRVGIIGRNGAGKSTLLKILSRITEPTKGRIVLKGRVASLLEVGTGFHPELTGRENIFLNGAVLGMSRSETRRKFDEIVDFAEVEKFLDTPVKRYSSGMYVRLAFAVAAHLEPEILIVDEVLAVGDIAFQKKCLGKMEHVASEGRTVLFVSHNMPSVLSLTRRCILLEKGLVVAIGETERVVGQYLKQFESLLSNSGMAEFTDADRDMSLQGPKGKLTRARLLNENGEQSGTFAEGEPVMLEMGFRILEEVQEVQLGCTVRSKNGQVN
ncbi:ABC transporter ATP-binding protein, partial [Sphingobacteriales bacterium CHB3]|nr:ABC transporter ATP-binding protein [Sphingobacteriales bacterium CHB3]